MLSTFKTIALVIKGLLILSKVVAKIGFLGQNKDMMVDL